MADNPTKYLDDFLTAVKAAKVPESLDERLAYEDKLSDAADALDTHANAVSEAVVASLRERVGAKYDVVRKGTDGRRSRRTSGDPAITEGQKAKIVEYVSAQDGEVDAEAIAAETGTTTGPKLTAALKDLVASGKIARNDKNGRGRRYMAA